jgi:1-deoxy-D-xylulose-5-phosphate reductoisomerase
MKNILLLGATGSIGESALSVISQNNDLFNLIGISFNKNISRCEEIISNFSPEYIHASDKESFQKLSNMSGNFLNEDSELEELILNDRVDIIICATSGFSGLKLHVLQLEAVKKFYWQIKKA